MKGVKHKLFYIFSLSVIGLAIWLSVLYSTTPEQADWITYTSFYGSQIVWAGGFLSLVIFYLKSSLLKSEIFYPLIVGSIRQGLLLSVLISSLIFFQQLEVLSWWDAILLSVIIGLSEAVFQSKFWNETK